MSPLTAATASRWCIAARPNLCSSRRACAMPAAVPLPMRTLIHAPAPPPEPVQPAPAPACSVPIPGAGVSDHVRAFVYRQNLCPCRLAPGAWPLAGPCMCPLCLHMRVCPCLHVAAVAPAPAPVAVIVAMAVAVAADAMHIAKPAHRQRMCTRRREWQSCLHRVHISLTMHVCEIPLVRNAKWVCAVRACAACI